MSKSAQTRSVTESRLVSDVTTFFEAFLDAEEDLFNHEISGVPYWHFIRFQFFDQILGAKKWIEKRPPGKVSPQGTLAAGLRLIKNSILHPIDLDKLTCKLLILNGSRAIVRHGANVDPYLHPWIEKVSMPYTVWENPLMWRHKPHDGNRALFYLDVQHLRSAIHQIIVGASDSEIQNEVKWLVGLANQLDVTLPERPIHYMIKQAVSFHRSGFEHIRRLLRRKHIRLLLLVNHYDPLKMLITSAAKSIGVRVVELQHGAMGRYHIAYNFRHRKGLNTLPDEIFTYGKFWNDSTRISQNQVTLTAVGSPFFEERINQTRSVPSQPRPQRPAILIMSQEVLGARIGRVALELWKRLSKEYDIVYKLHPREYDTWQTVYPKEFRSSGIQIVGNVDLYVLLQRCDIHIGVYSTTIIESLAFRKQLILLEFYGAHYFTDLIESGRALFARNADEVVQAIQAAGARPANMADLGYYWAQNSATTVLQRINELVA